MSTWSEHLILDFIFRKSYDITCRASHSNQGTTVSLVCPGFYIRSISYTIFLGLFWHRKTFYGGHWLQLPRTVDACLLTRLEKKDRPSSTDSFLERSHICHTLHSLTLSWARPVTYLVCIDTYILRFCNTKLQVALWCLSYPYVPMTFIYHFQVRNLTWYVALDASCWPSIWRDKQSEKMCVTHFFYYYSVGLLLDKNSLSSKSFTISTFLLFRSLLLEEIELLLIECRLKSMNMIEVLEIFSIMYRIKNFQI